jgi:cell division protein FtsB
MFDWLKIRSTLADARKECNNLRSRIESNRLRIEDLKSLPPPREELADLIAQFVDDAGKLYPQKLAASLQHFIRNPTECHKPQYRNCGDLHGDLRILTVTEHANGTPTHSTVETALLCLLGDQLKASVRKVVQEMEYPAIVGPAMPKRMSEIDRLTKENVELKAKLQEMEQELSAAAVHAHN